MEDIDIWRAAEQMRCTFMPVMTIWKAIKMKGLAEVTILLIALSPPAWAQIPNLTGEWEAPFTVSEETPQALNVEDVKIQQSGSTIEATKITGDEYVPAGMVNLNGTLTSSPFAAQQLCYDPAFQRRFWMDVTVTILDKDHLRVEGGCSGDVVWKRKGGVPIS